MLLANPPLIKRVVLQFAPRPRARLLSLAPWLILSKCARNVSAAPHIPSWRDIPIQVSLGRPNPVLAHGHWYSIVTMAMYVSNIRACGTRRAWPQRPPRVAAETSPAFCPPGSPIVRHYIISSTEHSYGVRAGEDEMNLK